MASKKSRRNAAKAAARRIPIVGTAVVAAPIVKAAVDSGLAAAPSMASLQSFFTELKNNFASTDGARLTQTYGPIAAYLLARRFAGKHISRVLRPLGVKF